MLATTSSVGAALGMACTHAHASKLEEPKSPDYAAASCHAGPPGTAAFQPRVILQNGQIPKHAEGVKGTPSF
ncbi:MAG: hypothetical protein QM820_07475 [Minicystis sp.]